jgi:hypothetical protein
MHNVQNRNTYTSMTNLNDRHKPSEPHHVNVKRCIKLRKDSSQLQAYSCTHFLNAPHLELRKRTGGSLPRGSISTECVMFGSDMKTWLPAEWCHACVSQFSHSSLSVLCVFSPLVTRMQFNLRKRYSREKTLIGRTNIVISLLRCPWWFSFTNSANLCLTFPRN